MKWIVKANTIFPNSAARTTFCFSSFHKIVNIHGGIKIKAFEIPWKPDPAVIYSPVLCLPIQTYFHFTARRTSVQRFELYFEPAQTETRPMEPRALHTRYGILSQITIERHTISEKMEKQASSRPHRPHAVSDDKHGDDPPRLRFFPK